MIWRTSLSNEASQSPQKVLQHDAMHPIEPQAPLENQLLVARAAAGHVAWDWACQGRRSIGMEGDRQRDGGVGTESPGSWESERG